MILSFTSTDVSYQLNKQQFDALVNPELAGTTFSGEFLTINLFRLLDKKIVCSSATATLAADGVAPESLVSLSLPVMCQLVASISGIPILLAMFKTRDVKQHQALHNLLA